MRVLLQGETVLTLSGLGEPELELSHAPGAHLPFGAFQMFVVGVGLCAASVLASYGKQVGVGAAGLSLQLSWSMAESPPRIGKLDLRFAWPELPESRQRAAELAAAQCPLTRTLEQPPEVTVKVKAGEAAQQAPAGPEAHAHTH